jgi:hypothetical protein
MNSLSPHFTHRKTEEHQAYVVKKTLLGILRDYSEESFFPGELFMPFIMDWPTLHCILRARALEFDYVGI